MRTLTLALPAETHAALLHLAAGAPLESTALTLLTEACEYGRSGELRVMLDLALDAVALRREQLEAVQAELRRVAAELAQLAGPG